MRWLNSINRKPWLVLSLHNSILLSSPLPLFVYDLLFMSLLLCGWVKCISILYQIWLCMLQQERPNLSEDIPTDLAFIIQSCWVEDPNMRPSFSQIVRMLNEFLSTLPPQSPSLPEHNFSEEAMTSNGSITEFSARARGKFAFLRQLFAAKKARNSQ